MRWRLPFRLVIIVASFLLIFYICYSISSQIIDNLVLGKSKEIPRRQNVRNILEKSVYIRDNGTDSLVTFSAHRQGPFIYVTLSSFGYFQRKVYCRYFDAKKEEVPKPSAVMIFPEFTAKCENRKEAEFIILTVDKQDEVKMEKLVEIQENRRGLQYDFSICLAPIYGTDPKWLTLLEFIEFYKLQDADHFYVYVLEVDDLVENILGHYKKTNLVEIISLPNNTGCLGRHRCRHEFQLQECLIRARGVSKFVGTVDLDERIVPTKGTLKSFAKTGATSSIGEFRFRCQWILRYEDIPTKMSESWEEVRNQMPTVRWHNSSHVAPLNHTTKSIINPEKVESMGVHQVLRFRKGADVFLVPAEDALVRHYRIQKGWDFFLKEAETFGNFSQSSIEMGLQKELENSVKQTILFVVGIIPFVCSRPEIDLKSRHEELLKGLQNYMRRYVEESQNRAIEKESMPSGLEQAAIFLAEEQMKHKPAAMIANTAVRMPEALKEGGDDEEEEDDIDDGRIDATTKIATATTINTPLATHN